MWKPIPEKILRSTAEVKVCTGINVYQQQTYETYTVQHVHLQPTSEVRKSTDNTDQQLKSLLFVDVRHSTPALDWEALFLRAQANGGDMRVIVRGVEYTVLTVDALWDGTDHLHHYEVGLV